MYKSDICDALLTTIREKSAPVRIGIDIGGTDTKIGLVDIHQKIITSVEMKTNASRTPWEVISEIGQKTLELLEQQGIVNIVNIFRPQLVLSGGTRHCTPYCFSTRRPRCSMRYG